MAMESILTIIFSLLLGGVALSVGLKILRVRRQVKQWPTVVGTVVDRGVELSSVRPVSTPGSRYRATVKYTYEVAGQHYEGDKILPLGNFTGSRAIMQREVDGFGSSVQVRYNPGNPAEACLKNEPAWWGFGILAASALCFLMGLLTLTIWLVPGK
jgi:hypothetical protein